MPVSVSSLPRTASTTPSDLFNHPLLHWAQGLRITHQKNTKCCVDLPFQAAYLVPVGPVGGSRRAKREAGGIPALPRSGNGKRTVTGTGYVSPGSDG